MSERPRVSVLMSVWNGERYLRQAIDSILGQTFSDFEFIIVDDASTDSTEAIMQSYHDPRILLLKNEHRVGFVRSLNRGLLIGTGEYIARQDADDISLPERITKQVDYLDRHPEVGLLGTWTEAIDEQGAFIGEWRTPVTNGLIQWSLLFGTCLAHPSIMMRRSTVEKAGAYDERMSQSEDYELWCRMSSQTQVANLPEVLVQRRIHSTARSIEYSEQINELDKHVMQREAQRLLGRGVSQEEVSSLHHAVWGKQPLSTANEVRRTAKLIRSLYSAYAKHVSLPCTEAKQVRRDVAQHLARLALNNARVFRKAVFLVLCQAVTLFPGILVSAWPIRFGLKYFGFAKRVNTPNSTTTCG